MKEHEIPCELCGEVYDPDELIPFDDRLICPECLENETTLCACCGQRIWLTDNAGNDNTPLCQTYYDQSYMTCSECGRLIHCEDTYYLDDSDEPLCLTCLEEEQEPAIARILYFVEKHWEELLKFSRRTPRQLERWAARYGYKDRPQEILEHAKKGSHAGRYSCVNLENRATIEFRMFRGTLKLNSLLATLQMVDHICSVALHLSDGACKDLSWTTFVTGCHEPELVQYLKERRLYVNEPVEGGEEI